MRNHWVCLDVETTIPEENTVSGPGGGANPYGGARPVYLGWRVKGDRDVSTIDCHFHEALTRAMEHEGDGAVVLIGHNISFDLHHLCKDTGIAELPGEVTIWDTMTAEYYLEAQVPESRSVKLEELFRRYGWDAPKDDKVKEYFAQGIGADLIPPDEILPYLVNDVDGTLHVAKAQLSRAAKSGMLPFMRDQMDAQLMFTVMEQNGLWVNAQCVDELVTQNEGAYARMERDLTELVTKRLDGLDPARTVLGDAQVKAAICGGTYVFKGKRQDGEYKNGKPKMRVFYDRERKVTPLTGFHGEVPDKFDELSIKGLVAQCGSPARDYLQMVLDFRAVRKDMDTYVEGYLRRVDSEGIMRTSYNQAITPSGRVSSSNPNLQNLPN